MIKWRKNGTMPISGAAFSGPIFDDPPYSTGGFRDPTTAWQGKDKVWRMATGCGDKKKGGACLFKSKNFVNWTAVGWLHHPQGPQNTQFWEWCETAKLFSIVPLSVSLTPKASLFQPGLLPNPRVRQVGAEGLRLRRLVVARRLHGGGWHGCGHLCARVVRCSRRLDRWARAAEVRLRTVL